MTEWNCTSSSPRETKRYYRFEDPVTETSLYLKKDDVRDAGINPRRGIVVTVEEEPK